ncbi:peptidoglycan binding domain-containing protein [Clostridium sp.]|uniref:L,D-transpeptidase family protein n=1 Tax=Clostridium sp. TaxID=1506 RepID=UPI0032170657
MEVEKNRRIKITICTIISLCALLVIYFSMSLYFINRFYFGSVIDGINACGKTVGQIEEEILSRSKTYALELKERGNVKEVIQSNDIGLKYDLNGEVQVLKDNQNPFGWIYGVFNTQEFKMIKKTLYDEELLRKSFENLACFDSGNIIEPQNAKLEYMNNEYVIVDEVKGNKINKDALYEKVVDVILKGETIMDLESINCYEEPKYTSGSKEIIEAKNILEKYTASKITYTFGEHTEVLDESIIHDWVEVDENFKISLDEEKAKNYIDTLANRYDTVGGTREFVTSSGVTKNVSGGDYGWLINRYEEVEYLVDAIKEGQSITKEPIYAQSAVAYGTNDIGNTYVEIDLTKQHIWFYKDGSLIVEGDVVTGNVSSNHSTPAGTYKLDYKQKDAILRGDDYATPVSFWMPFNSDIGLHDATWRTDFGGSIYLTNGSHGCVNAPYYVADAIFYNIEDGAPIICYF